MIADPCRAPFTELAKRCKDQFGDQAQVEEKWLKRPVPASGEILIVNLT